MFDPIELWNSPTSQTRKEKEFFDSTFRPFYRPCQIIVKAKDVPPEIPYTDENTGESYIFGPAFNETFMKDLLQLQLDIEEIVSVGQYNVSLKDVREPLYLLYSYSFGHSKGEPFHQIRQGHLILIRVVVFQVCNKPLDPEDDSCNIQNIWAYWQDSERNFDNHDYLAHALQCFSNPSYTNPIPGVLSCLGKNGVPVQPYYVLGGFIPEDVDGFPEDPQYEKSSAVLLQAS